jgi:hypothetical protein
MNFINLGGKQRPFKFGFNAMDIFCKEYGTGIGAFSEIFAKLAKGESPPGVMRDIIYSGLTAGALSHNEPTDFTKFTVGDWIDELGSEGLAEVMKVITESLVTTDKKKAPERGFQNLEKK